MESIGVRGARALANSLGHMTNVATMPINNIQFNLNPFSGTKRLLALKDPDMFL